MNKTYNIGEAVKYNKLIEEVLNVIEENNLFVTPEKY